MTNTNTDTPEKRAEIAALWDRIHLGDKRSYTGRHTSTNWDFLDEDDQSGSPALPESTVLRMMKERFFERADQTMPPLKMIGRDQS